MPRRERDEAEVMGVVIGTCDGWDMVDTLNVVFYDYKSNPEFCRWLPDGDVNFDFNKGTIDYFDDNGVLIRTFNMVEVLKGAADAV